MGKKKQYCQKFNPLRLKDPILKSWVQQHPNDDNRVICKFDKSVLNSKKFDLLEHSKTRKHILAAKPLSSARQMKIDAAAVTTSLINKPEAQQKIIAELRLSMFIAVHTSILPVDHLSEIVVKTFHFKNGDTASIRLHRTKCTETIINVIAPHFERKLEDDVADEFYSLIIDESTDISTTKLLAIVIRYYSKQSKAIKSTFLDLVDIEAGDTDTITEAIKAV